MELIYIILIVVAVIALLVVAMYNGLVSSRNQVKTAWATVDTQLQRRFDLIPNLIETVKGYMAHEKETLENITKARSSFQSANSVEEKAQSESSLIGALRTFYAVAENYPDLKASQNFMMLQEELSATENKVAYARQNYNNTVLSFNNKIEQFPSNIIANMFSFKAATQFTVESEEARKAPQVKF